MFLTVFLSNNEQNVTEVPITPETLCRDVVEFCKEPGEGNCYLAQTWRGSERALADGERIIEVMKRGAGPQGAGLPGAEVQYLLHHQRAPPGPDTGGSRGLEQLKRRPEKKVAADRCLDQVTLSDLQDLATRQQRQIDVQQQLLVSKEHRLHFLKLRDQRQQQEASEHERLKKLRENAENQEEKLKRVRALRGRVEERRQGNSRLVEEMKQLSALFQQKQRELLVAATRAEQLSEQLEMLRRNGAESHLPAPPLHHHFMPSSTGELEHLYKELQLRNRLNQEQSCRLQQQRDVLTKRNQEVAAMDRRLVELRQRLWKRKATLQQKENLPVTPEYAAPQCRLGSRVAAVGPYIQSSLTSGPQGPQAYPHGAAPNLSLKPPPRPVKPAEVLASSKTNKRSNWNTSMIPDSHASTCPDFIGGFSHASTIPHMSSVSRSNSGGDTLTGGSNAPPPVPSRTNHSTDNLLHNTQPSGKGVYKVVPPPVPSKPKPISWGDLPMFSGTGTFPGKARQGGHLRSTPVASGHSHTLPLLNKQESPPAATVRPYTPDNLDATPPVLHKPPTVAASSIYSMYTQQTTPAKSQQVGGQGTLPRSQPRVYGKPVLPSIGGQQSTLLEITGSDVSEVNNSCQEIGQGVSKEPAERAPPRPLSPTKLLPFLSNAHRNPSDVDLEALRRRLHHAPRPLKKRSSITEPEGPGGPNIQKLLYQKTTLAAMETIAMETAVGLAAAFPQSGGKEDRVCVSEVGDHTGARFNSLLTPSPEEFLTPPPLPPRSPIPDSTLRSSPRFAPEDEGELEREEGYITSAHHEEFPSYPPPPYPKEGGWRCKELGDDTHYLQPPEVTGQVTALLGKNSILRKVDSEPIRRDVRVKFNPLALLLDSSLEGEYDLVQRVIYDVDDPSAANDEGITALHNAVCAGHAEIVKFLVQFGVNVNSADSDGWTPLHCAASCNNVQVCKFLVESGAAVFAATHSDTQTAAEKCEEMEEGYAQCSQFLYGVQEKMGVMNRGVVYALWDFASQSDDELAFSEGDVLTVLRRDDEVETEWWWARCGDHEGFIPRNLLGIYPRIKPRQRSLA